MNILVIHETEYLEKVVFEYQIIPELWANEGHNVYVIDFETNWKKNSFFDLASKTKIIKGVRKANKRRGVTLVRPWFIKIPGVSRTSAAISHYYEIKKIVLDKKIDVIFLYSVPTNGYQVIRLAKKLKVPVYFRLLDVLNQLVPYRIFSTPTYFLEKYVYKKVDYLTAITPRLTKYAIKLGANPKTTTYLPSGSDSDLFYPEQKNTQLMKSLGIKKTDKVITFAGTLYNFSGLDKILKYFAKNISSYPNLKFLIIGHGEQGSYLKKIIRENRLENWVIMTGFVDYQDLGRYLNLSDICINPFEINKITDIIFPGKIYQYLACEKPVIATKLSGVLDIFPDKSGARGIYYYNYKKPSEFFDLIKTIKLKPIKDKELSLQDIAKTILDDFKKLI
jgi:glycosyltransferase involved in cell wall biosynthesis